MNELKEFKPIALVFYIDGNWQRTALPLDEDKRDAFKRAIETHKMVELEWIVINTFDIKEIRSADKVSDIEKCYYSMSWHERAYVNQRAKTLSDNPKINAIEFFSGRPDKVKAIERMESMVEHFRENLDSNKE